MKEVTFELVKEQYTEMRVYTTIIVSEQTGSEMEVTTEKQVKGELYVSG